MKKRMKRGSMTIEAALLMPLLLLVVTITLYLFFYVHNKVWLTAAAYEAALDGSPVTWIRKVKGLSEVSNKLKG